MRRRLRSKPTCKITRLAPTSVTYVRELLRASFSRLGHAFRVDQRTVERGCCLMLCEGDRDSDGRWSIGIELVQRRRRYPQTRRRSSSRRSECSSRAGSPRTPGSSCTRSRYSRPVRCVRDGEIGRDRPLRLVPRLTDIRRVLPGVDIRLQAAEAVVALHAGRVDVAVRYGRGPYLGVHATVLREDCFGPV